MADKPNKWAVIIGIDKYPNLARRYELHGCVNDADLMADILQRSYGFSPERIMLLRDAYAHRDNILKALDGLAERVQEDDIVVIHYSGHGSQMTDRENDEADGRDETIVPFDSGRGSKENRDITDDEIYMRLLPLAQKTPYVTLIFDCCHSGTISRDAFGTNSRWVEPDLRTVDELPPSPIPQDLAADLQATTRDLGPSGWLPLGQRYVLLAGCRDEESSYEHTAAEGEHGRPVTHGALTYFLGQELVNAVPGTTYRDVFERAAARVTAAHPRQHPQTEGARDRELFGVRDIEPMRFVPVQARSGEQVTLGAGAAHGLTVGSRWTLYAQGTKQVTDEMPSLGQVEITEVRAVSADARIVEETSPGAIVIDSRAVETAHNYGDMRLVVDVYPAPAGHEDTVDALGQRIEASRLLRLRAEDEPVEAADVRAYLLAPRDAAGEDEPVPQLGALARATWAVVSGGQLAMPQHDADERDVMGLLVDNLEKLARYRNTLELRNPNADPDLQKKIVLRLKRRPFNGQWEEVEADQQPVFEVDDMFAFEITNEHSAPVYFSLLDFGVTGGISLLYPINTKSEKLEPGTTMSYGQRTGEEIDMWIPDEFEADRGVETFKLFVTTHEADFSWMEQQSVRDLDREIGLGTAMEQLFAMAYSGQGTRDARRRRVPRTEEWFTIERSLIVQRRTL
jgi:hypothetical protein